MASSIGAAQPEAEIQPVARLDGKPRNEAARGRRAVHVQPRVPEAIRDRPPPTSRISAPTTSR